jgi:hypothetical protein
MVIKITRWAGENILRTHEYDHDLKTIGEFHDSVHDLEKRLRALDVLDKLPTKSEKVAKILELMFDKGKWPSAKLVLFPLKNYVGREDGMKEEEFYKLMRDMKIEYLRHTLHVQGNAVYEFDCKNLEHIKVATISEVK